MSEPRHTAPSTRPSKARELFGIDVRSLAALRIALAVLVLADLGTRAEFLGVFYTDGGPHPRSLFAEGVLPHFSAFFLSGSAAVQGGLFALTAACALALLVGWRTWPATLATWLLVSSLQMRSPFITNNGDVLLRMLLFWSLFLPLGAHLSLDARRRGPPCERQLLSVGTVAVLMQLVLLYVVAGVVKSSPPWMDGTAVQRVMWNEHFARTPASWLRELPWLTALMTWGTLVLEIIGPFLLFSPWKTGRVRVVVLASLWALQLGLAFSIELQLFPWASTVATLPFLTAGFWDRLGWRLAPTPGEAGEDPGTGSVAWWRRGTSSVPAQVLCGVFLVNALLLNAPALVGRGVSGIERTGFTRAVGMIQGWRLFAIVPQHDISFLVFGTFADGRRSNLLNQEGDARWELVRRAHRDYRFRYMTWKVSRRSEELRALLYHHLDWVCREWNAGSARPVEVVGFVQVKRPIRPDGLGPPKRTVLLEHTCGTGPTRPR